LWALVRHLRSGGHLDGFSLPEKAIPALRKVKPA
jgi:hypothetical protein